MEAVTLTEMTPLDESLFNKYRSRPELREVTGFAPNADALVSQVFTTMASEPVCSVAIPPLEDPDIKRLLSFSSPDVRMQEPLSFPSRKKWTVVVIPKSFELSDGRQVVFDNLLIAA